MGLLNVIRRMALREQLPIREISRRTGLSRNTIAKYLNAGTIEPKFTTPDRPSKLDPFADKLAGFLAPTSGGVVLNGHAVTGPDKERGMDFQHGALFEWMNVRDNVSFGPRMAGQRRSDQVASTEVVEFRVQAGWPSGCAARVGFAGFTPSHEDPVTGDRMALIEALRQADDGNFLRSLAETVLQSLMEFEREESDPVGRSWRRMTGRA